tara:strand:+ start:78 stop:497 length:420 start_codon:yes stop_codon:yes gene_type:complete
MIKSFFTISIGTFLLLPFQSLKSQTYLNYNQPYVNPPGVEEPFLTKSDNDNFWEVIKSIREKQLGYKDTEFNRKIDWCRYVGESSVLQKKEEFTVSNVVDYSTRCMQRQTRMIRYFLDNDILEKEEDVLKDDSKVGLKQ